jgi:hypothetical protein
MGEFEGRWVAKLVARLLAPAALWVESRHLSKIRNGRHKQRSVSSLDCQKIYKKGMKISVQFQNRSDSVFKIKMILIILCCILFYYIYVKIGFTIENISCGGRMLSQSITFLNYTVRSYFVTGLNKYTYIQLIKTRECYVKNYKKYFYSKHL